MEGLSVIAGGGPTLEPSLGSDRFAETLARLDELGPPSELLERAPAEAAVALDLDRVVLSRVDHGRLTAQSLHAPAWQYSVDDALGALRAAPTSIDYPSVEGEVLRRRRPQLVRAAGDGDPVVDRRAYAEVMGWREYVVAPIMLEGRVIGFFHGDRHAGRRPLDEQDAADMGTFALCFAIVYERAILRTRLRVQRQEMRQIASWAASRTSELSDRAITLGPDDVETVAGTSAAAAAGRGDGTGDSALAELLTRRELEVLRLMVQGRTNADIAREFVVAQGTVKFHVKNILRKLHAANRAEATSRYLRLTLGQGGPGGG